MSRATPRERLRALALIAPLGLFLAIFFIWPLWMMIEVSVRNDAIAGAFPATAAVISEWDGEGMPDAAIQQALVEDFRSTPSTVLGAAIRTLNSQVSGFRTLASRTTAAVRKLEEGETVDLPGVDRRWSDLRYWTAIQTSLSPYTDRNLLA